MAKNKDWYKFQEEICDYFNSIGAESKTNITIKGVRTTHDIDILVQTKFLGEDLLWVIEAKKWKYKVSKLHVLGLRTIVDDIGADRGFIISELGFQKGAIEASKNTNIKLKTFDELKIDTRDLVESEILKTYKKRISILEARYWSHSKSIRKDYGLRDEVWSPFKFSGQILLSTIEAVIFSAEKKEYPICLDTMLEIKTGELIANNFQQLCNWLNLNLNLLDEMIIKAEVEMQKNGDFNPSISFDEFEKNEVWDKYKEMSKNFFYDSLKLRLENENGNK